MNFRIKERMLFFPLFLLAISLSISTNANVVKSHGKFVYGMPINEVLGENISLTGVNVFYSNDFFLPSPQIQYITQKPDKGKVITGHVRDERGEPIPFAYVLIKGQSMGTSTSEDGSYEIAVSDDVTLIFSYVGYTSMEISTKGKNKIDVILREASESLSEIVVTGYNSVERQHLSSAIEVLDIDKAQTRPISKLQEAFGGTIPGVVLNKSTGIPGGSSSINIRGISTLQNTEPLVIVDGIEQSMSDLDLSQIQSITVLKDAAAASMYGSRGANGVIVIETKRGETGNFKVSVNAWGAINQSIEKPNFVGAYDYAILTNEAHASQGLAPAFNNEEVTNIKNGKIPSINWLKEITPYTACSYNTTANITGGGGVGRFSLMLSYNNEKGETGLDGSNKFSTRFNTNINLADKFIIMADFYAHRLNVDREFGGGANTTYEQAWKMNPVQQIYYPDKGIKIDAPKHYILYNDINPVAFINEGGWRKNMYDRITINLRPRYYLMSKLYLAGDLSYMINKSAHKQERMTYKFFDGNGKPVTVWGHEVSAEQGVSESQLTARGTINYETDIRNGLDKLYIIGGSEIMSTSYTNYNEYSKASFYGKATYSLGNRYMLEGTLRGDGSSKFAPGYQWGIFPSFSIGWNMHNENFISLMKENGVINILKFRASWGKIGNENVAPYLWQEVVNTWGWTMRVPNPMFTWEKQKQWNLGIDFSLFKNKLSGSFDIYQKYSYDLIYSDFPVPPLTGSYYLTTAANIGEVKNKGVESSLRWTDRIRNLRYSIGVIFHDNKNSMQKVGYNKGDILVFKNDPNKIWIEGAPIDNFYGYLTNGFFQSQDEINNATAVFTGTKVGDIKYVDVNKDGIINDEDKVILGDPTPRYNYSLTLNMDYKNWDFFLLGQGVGKRDGSILGLEGQPVINDGNTNTLGTPRKQYMEGRWTPENPNSRYPRMWTGNSPNSFLSSVWMSDASYFRLKSLQIGYTFRRVTKGVSNLRVYANAENFLTITNWEGLEPERIRGGNGTYPMMATYSLGVQATFF